jgi:hypothetical protein
MTPYFEERYNFEGQVKRVKIFTKYRPPPNRTETGAEVDK